MSFLPYRKMSVSSPCNVNHPARKRFHGFDFGLTHSSKLGVLMNPRSGQLLLHLAASFTDDRLIGKILITSQHAPSRRFIQPFRRFQNCDRIEFATGIAGAGDHRDHGLAEARAVEWRFSAIEMRDCHSIKTLDAVPFSF